MKYLDRRRSQEQISNVIAQSPRLFDRPRSQKWEPVRVAGSRSPRNLWRSSSAILHETSMTYGVVAIHYQGDDKFTLARVDRVNLKSQRVVLSSRFRRVVGLSRLIKKAMRKQARERKRGGEKGGRGNTRAGWLKGAVEGGEGIKRDIGNIKYKCNLPRFMSAEERRAELSGGEKKRKTKRTMEKERMVVASRRDEVAARRSGDHTESRACSWLVGGPSFHFPPALSPETLLSPLPPFFPLATEFPS